MLEKEFYINSSKENYNIFCDLYLPDNKNIKKVIIACHGFGGDKRSSAIIALAKSLTNFDIGVVAFDFPGHGISKADGYYYTVENCISDIDDVEQYIKNSFKNIEVGFFATSFGAYVTLLKINKSNNIYDSVVLRCPAIDMRKVFENNILKMPINEFLENGKCTLGFERKIIITKEYYDSLVKNDIFKIYNKNNKILIIHGTEDITAPINDSIKFQNMFEKGELIDCMKVYRRSKKELDFSDDTLVYSSDNIMQSDQNALDTVIKLRNSESQITQDDIFSLFEVLTDSKNQSYFKSQNVIEEIVFDLAEILGKQDILKKHIAQRKRKFENPDTGENGGVQGDNSDERF